MLALDRTIAPDLDRHVDLLVQVGHRRGATLVSPCLREVLDSAHRQLRYLKP